MKVVRGVLRRLRRSAPTSNLQALRSTLAEVGRTRDQARLIRAFGTDLRRFYALVPREGDEYWNTLHGGVKALDHAMEADSWLALPLHHRLAASLVVDGRRDDLTAVLVDRNENGSSFRVAVHDDRLVAHPGYERLIEKRFDAPFVVPHVSDLPLVACLDDVWCAADDVLHIAGHAYIANVDFGRNRCALTLSLVSTGAEHVVVEFEHVVDGRIDLESRDRYNSYAGSAFTAVLDPQALLDIVDASGNPWHLEATVSSGPLSRTGPFSSYDDRGPVGLLPLPIATCDRLLEIGFDAVLGLMLRVLTTEPPTAEPSAATGYVVDTAVVDRDNGILTLTGHGSEDAELPVELKPVELKLVSPSGSFIAGTLEVDRERHTFSAVFPLASTVFGSTGLAPTPGTYRLVDDRGQPVQAVGELVRSLPHTRRTPLTLVEFRRMAGDGGLGVTFATPLRDDERGRLNQRRLQGRIPALNESTDLADAMVFECFGGKAANGSVLALFTELRRRFPDHAMYWGISDHSVAVPVGAQAVLLHSRQWYEVLHASKFLINNANFPYYFRKTPGQFYLQTWHGTPLKRIANDVPSASLSLSYRALMEREAGYWDVLLAQNDYAGKVLPAAFGFGGRILAEGYPHNDILARGGNDVGSSVRVQLGIADGTAVVLYAPTWRDDAKNANTGHELVTFLDFERARQRLGSDVVFLLRGHINTRNGNTRRGQRTTGGDGVIDVTAYPEIADLYLAADVLVTDYSSVMFDFCVTGKPIVFLAPDLEHYRDSTRGFYVDYAAEVPGPIARTTDEVVAVLMDLPATVEAYRSKYERFVQTYASRDDGEATTRVVDELFGKD